MFQKILGGVILAIGLVYAAVLVRSCLKDKKGMLACPGSLSSLRRWNSSFSSSPASVFPTIFSTPWWRGTSA